MGNTRNDTLTDSGIFSSAQLQIFMLRLQIQMTLVIVKLMDAMQIESIFIVMKEVIVIILWLNVAKII